MLTKLDKKLIEQESHRFDTKEVKTWLKHLEECPITYEQLFENYNLHEFTIHWYDSMPRFDNISCDLCDRNCDKCPTWEKWQGSEKQLSFNNWIDVEGPGMWGMTQEECNRAAKERFKQNILQDKEFYQRTYFYQPPEEKHLNIFWYNRDRKNFDYWFVFKKKRSLD
jgi:hypothetical protein